MIRYHSDQITIYSSAASGEYKRQVLLLAIFAGNFIHGWTASGPLERAATVIVKPGSSMMSAARQLEKSGAIKSADAFVSRAKIFGASNTIKAGEFVIPAKASNSDILAIPGLLYTSDAADE